MWLNRILVTAGIYIIEKVADIILSRFAKKECPKADSSQKPVDLAVIFVVCPDILTKKTSIFKMSSVVPGS